MCMSLKVEGRRKEVVSRWRPGKTEVLGDTGVEL